MGSNSLQLSPQLNARFLIIKADGFDIRKMNE